MVVTVVIISLTFCARLLSSSSGFSRTFITVSHENSGLPFPSQMSNTRAKQSIQLYPSVVFGTGFFLKIHPGHQLIQCSSHAKCPTNGRHLEYWTSPGRSWRPSQPPGGKGGMEREREGEKKWERANVFSVHNVN